ncbi:flagellar protein FliT [Clostridium sp. P21]|uniref:Flagellar protein FliT n=1 Tax=Clostridium muellerianum TaxID=2716538 RepID=A0A7Y0HM48_9CLOT|nr:flagellar protein FliT [Clostridium muellerianum]NMM61277.1 flagellar protein FliT [Clostridium muellerianum]
MNTELEGLLNQYREYTLKLINVVEEELYDDVEGLLTKREHIIDQINSNQHTKDEFSKVAKDLQILILQKKLTDLMNQKKSKIKNKLKSMAKNKSARKSYNKKFSVDSLFFNKKM